MNIIEQIRAEIERRKNEQVGWIEKGLPGKDLALAVQTELEQLLSFLDTLESEKPVEGLDEAASNAGFDYVDDIVLLAEPNHRWNDHDVEQAYSDGFKAGAEWDMEQMMKEAVEYEVWDFSSSLEACPHVNIPLDNRHYRSGDKVRVIILPKEVRNEQI